MNENGGNEYMGTMYYGMYQPMPMIGTARPMNEPTARLKKNFRFFGIGSMVYACFYALCMYRNGSGITYPFFLAGSLWFYCFCMKKLEISLKKDRMFYMAGILLLGLSTFLTADWRIIAMNKTGVCILTFSFLLHHFFEDGNWTFGRYVCYVIATMVGCLGEIPRPFQDWAFYRRTDGKNKKGVGMYILIGALIAVPLFLIIWLLLMFADGIFMDMTESLFRRLDIGNIFGVAFTVIFMFFLTYWITAFLCNKPFSEEYRERRQTEAVLAITVTLPITLLYIVFCGIQIVVLFLGRGLGNHSYAEYARQGFFQLLAVCVINLILVLLGHAFFKENKALKIILTIMSFCTYIMIASSAYRMILYIKHYYLTFLRLFVLWALVVLSILLTGVIVSIYKKKFPLFKYSMVVVTLCYLALSFSHPDYWIAKCNVSNMGHSSSAFFDADAYRDYRYMSYLSADAAPALAKYFKEEGISIGAVEEAVDENRIFLYEYPVWEIYGGSPYEENAWCYYYLHNIAEDYHKMGIRSFNLSRFLAYRINS